MDIEFHYYMTYLIAAKAGFGAKDALTIATACYYVDDNDMILQIDQGMDSAYRNYISQTKNILKPRGKLFRIYPLFHFIPGDPLSPTAWRKDGKMHWLNTTPDSENGNRILNSALATENLYRIGVASHAYADTWAHQNFVGYFDDFNAMKGPLSQALPNIGHAGAGRNPDRPALVWRDKRLLHEQVDNKTRFLDAAEHLLRKLGRHVDRTVTDPVMNEKVRELRQDLDWAIGEQDPNNCWKEERLARYRELSETAAYGDRKLPIYDGEKWFVDAIDEKVRGLRNRSEFPLVRLDPLEDGYFWKDRQNFKQSPWYCFQEAVKTHQQDAWDILDQSNMQGLELPEL